MIDIIIDAVVDVLKLIPFLFLSFLVMEYLEQKITNTNKINKLNKYGPIAASSLGIIPQCGFSALGANFYAARIISIGSLFSIFLSTSDEMLPILISHKVDIKIILKLLLTKFIVALLFGLIIDLIFQKRNKTDIKKLCDEDNCHCKEEGIIKSSIIHTLKIASFILIINLIFNIILKKSIIINIITSNKILTPILASIVGLIPNCAASVIITELYLDNVISFGSCIAGLLSSSGVGLVILFKQNKNLKENIFITIGLIFISTITGIILNIIM